ncbi:MAG: hypothetical protein NZ661_02155 [Candidatus Kapabacteria bacterium]|nr:hypothetical protein [Candidatus Kapabacteria bacterium]
MLLRFTTAVLLMTVTGMATMLSSCLNPFAPRLALSSDGTLLGDQRTIEGVFQNFRYAYIFKDTLTYGQLLDPNFVFIYRNYERNVDASWGRDEEMFSTNGLFRTAQALDLVWNEIIFASGDSLSTNIQRGFNLTVTFNVNDIIRLDGRVNLGLVREKPSDVWRIRRWRDESNF